MSPRTQTVVGVLLIAASAVLLLFFRDAELGWFDGQPLGVVLGTIGVIDLLETADRARRSP